MSEIKDYELYVNTDGYICFTQENGNIYWTLHSDGWEAYFPMQDEPAYETYEITFPTETEFEVVEQFYTKFMNQESVE
jgi:hypothetical protein